jgi:hypothetical protein
VRSYIYPGDVAAPFRRNFPSRGRLLVNLWHRLHFYSTTRGRRAVKLPKACSTGASLKGAHSACLKILSIFVQSPTQPQGDSSPQAQHSINSNMANQALHINVVDPMYARYIPLKSDLEIYLQERFGCDIDFDVSVRARNCSDRLIL